MVRGVGYRSTPSNTFVSVSAVTWTESGCSWLPRWWCLQLCTPYVHAVVLDKKWLHAWHKADGYARILRRCALTNHSTISTSVIITVTRWIMNIYQTRESKRLITFEQSQFLANWAGSLWWVESMCKDIVYQRSGSFANCLFLYLIVYGRLWRKMTWSDEHQTQQQLPCLQKRS